MFLNGYEIMAIAAIALLLFGTRIPMVARSLGSAIVQFRKAIKGDEPESSVPAKKDPDRFE